MPQGYFTFHHQGRLSFFLPFLYTVCSWKNMHIFLLLGHVCVFVSFGKIVMYILYIKV